MFFNIEQVLDYVEEKSYVLGRVAWRPVTHIFKNGKSLCGIWRLGLRVMRLFPGMEKPLCKRCVRSIQNEHSRNS
jgi:hypothetical protein